MFHYILEYCILLCYHSINTLIVPFVSGVFSTLHWLLAATAGTLMFLFVTLFLSYTVAFVIMVYSHGWPRSRFGLYNWFKFHYDSWKLSPMRCFLRNVWELFKITHDLHKPLSLKCRPLYKGSEISLEFDDTIVKGHTSNVTDNFTRVETLHVPLVMTTQATTILYTRQLQGDDDVLIKAIPVQPRQDDQVATAPNPAPTLQISAPTVPTTPTSVSTAPHTPTSAPQEPTAPTANTQPATPNPKKRAAANGGRPGGAKRGKGGACP